MKNSRGNLSEVLRKREEVINRIREKMPSEADALEALDMAAAALDANSPAMQAGEYTNTPRAIDALVAHLTKAGRPMKPGRLAKEVASAGWALGDPLAYARLWDAIRYQCDGAKKPLIMRLKDGTITLAPGARPAKSAASNSKTK